MTLNKIVGSRPGSDPLKPLRIISVGTGWSSEKGGLSTFNRYLVLGLRYLGHKVTCAVEACSADEVQDADSHGVALRTLDELNSLQADVIIGHGRITGKIAEEMAATKNSRRIHFIHTRPEVILHIRDDFPKAMIKGEEHRKWEMNFCDSADLVAAVGPVLQRHIATIASCDVHPFIPGLPTEFHAWEAVKSVPAELHCLMLGRVSDANIKGFDIGVAAVAGVRSKSGRSEPIAIIRGAQPSDPKASKALKAAAPPGTVILRPFSVDEEEIAREIRTAAVVLMPSREEGFGLVGLEAIAAGVPVLISSRSGLAEYLTEINAALR